MEQSKIKDQYTPEDFPYIDVEKVETIFSYHEDLENEAQLLITLSTHSKQAVLDAIDVLYEQPFVYSASVNNVCEITPPENNLQLENIIIGEVASSTATAQEEYLEYNANLYTYACCATKYINSSKNRTVKVGIMGVGVYEGSKAGQKLAASIDCTNTGLGSTCYGSHETQVANVIARNIVDDMNITHTSCGVNVCKGTCTNVQLYSLRIVDAYYESSLDYYTNAINYAINNGIDVLVCSQIFHGLTTRNSEFEAIVSSYQGVLVTSATNTSDTCFNNDNIDASTSIAYPTSCTSDNVIVVGACEYDAYAGSMVLESYSRYGKTTVDLMTSGATYDDFSFFEIKYGTSYAAPRVAGAAAVLLNIDPDLTAAQIRHYLLSGVDTYSSLTNYCATGGSLNVYRSAKMLISDLACDWKTVFSGHFTRTDKLQVAAYVEGGHNVMKCYVWTYDSSTGKFSDPEHWFTNYSYALNNNLGNNLYRSVAGDFDGDGYDEICTLYDHQDYLFVQDGPTGRHPGSIGVPVENFTRRVAALDMDGDNKDEIVAFYRDPNSVDRTLVYVWDFSGSGSSLAATQYIALDTGERMYNANCISGRIAAGDFDGDGKEEIGALYYFGPDSYALYMFDFTGFTASYRTLISRRTGIALEELYCRVVACNYNGGAYDEIVALYDNSANVSDGIINYGFCFSSSGGTWSATPLYTSAEYIYRADLSSDLIVSGDFNTDGYEDVVTFYKLPAPIASNVRGKIMMSTAPSLNGYYTVWDSKA